MTKIRFWIALWAGKFFLWLYKRTGRTRDDKPGMASMKLCDDFLKYVAKPELTVAVTGTNGKTTISSMITDILRGQGKTVAYNDWGANHHAGHARCLLDAVNIFNRPTKDVAVIEMDELISPISMEKIQPDYLIISNLSRDSMLRNAHPEYIRDHIEEAVNKAPDCRLIINGDDPLCCFIGSRRRRVFFGVADQHYDPPKNVTDDFSICPRCGTKPVYSYRNYRHIGEFVCPGCGLKNPDRDYLVESVDPETGRMTVREGNESRQYPEVSPYIFNIYNAIAVVAFFRELGTPYEQLTEAIKYVRVPETRETYETVEGIKLYTQMAKGQNAVATSTVFERVAYDQTEKEVVLLLDEVFDNPLKTETIAWIHDTDYERLNNEHIHRIIAGGERYLDHKVRLLMAGVPEEKIICVRDPFETVNYVDFEGIESIFVLHDVYFISKGHQIRDQIKQKILAERGQDS